MEANKGSSMELTNTADNPFDPISELLFLDHSLLLSHGKSSSPSSTANPEIFRHLRQRPVTTPFDREKLNPERTRHEIIPSKTQANDSTLYLTPIATRVISVHRGNVVGGGVRGNAQPAEIIERP